MARGSADPMPTCLAPRAPFRNGRIIHACPQDRDDEGRLSEVALAQRGHLPSDPASRVMMTRPNSATAPPRPVKTRAEAVSADRPEKGPRRAGGAHWRP